MKDKKYFVVTFFIWLFILTCSYTHAKGLNPQGTDYTTVDINQISIDSLIDRGTSSYRDDSAILLQSSRLALKQAREVGYQIGEAKALLNLAMFHTLYGEKDSAIVFSEQSIKIAEKFDSQEVVAKNHHYLGLAYQQSGKYKQALSEYFEALELNSQLGNYTELLKQNNNIAIVYRELKDYESAKKYLDKNYELAIKLGNHEIEIISKANQAYILLDQKRYAEADHLLNSVIPSLEKSNKLGQTICFAIKAQVLTGLKQFHESIEFAERAKSIAEELKYQEGIFNAMYAKASSYFSNDKYLKAISVAELALKNPASSSDTRYVHQLYNILTSSHRQIGNLENAFEYQDEYLRLNEQIFNEDQQNYATRLQIEYDLKEREIENQVLKNQSLIDRQQIKNQQYIYIFTSLIALLGLGLAFLFYKSTLVGKEYSQKLERAIDVRTKELQEANQELQNSNYELERFAFIASHDLKEPLKNVISFSELIQKEVKENHSESRLTDYANFVERGSKRLYALVHSIFEFSRINKDDLEDVKDFSLLDIVSDLKEDYVNKAEITFDNLPIIEGNTSLIYAVFQNLIQNSIKYNENDLPKIHINSYVDGSRQVVSIYDDGIGFESKYKDKVFDMFTRLKTKDEYEGAGLGLATCKKIMTAHKGEIWVESTEGEGSTFFLAFPANAA